MAIDYSLYLVTDSTEVILGDKDLIDVVHKAVEGGKSNDIIQIGCILNLRRRYNRTIP